MSYRWNEQPPADPIELGHSSIGEGGAPLSAANPQAGELPEQRGKDRGLPRILQNQPQPEEILEAYARAEKVIQELGGNMAGLADAMVTLQAKTTEREYITEVINITSGTTSILVGSIPSCRIAVYSYAVIATAALSFTWQSGSGTSQKALSGAMALAANGGIALPNAGEPILVGGVGHDLSILTNGGTLAGHLVWGTIETGP